MDRFLKNTSIESVLPSLFCRFFVLKGQQSWVLSTLTAMPSHLQVQRTRQALSLSMCVYIWLSHTNTHRFVHEQVCTEGGMAGCVRTAEYLIAWLYHHYCSYWVSASLIMTRAIWGAELPAKCKEKWLHRHFVSLRRKTIPARRSCFGPWILGEHNVCVCVCEFLPLEGV